MCTNAALGFKAYNKVYSLVFFTTTLLRVTVDSKPWNHAREIGKSTIDVVKHPYS